MERCLRTEKTLPVVAPQKVALQTSSNIREMARMRQSEPLIHIQQSKRAVAPQAPLRPSLWTNQSCNVAWSTSSSFSPDSLPCILLLDKWTELRVKEVRLCSLGSWFQRAPSTVTIWTPAQNQGWFRGSVLLPSLLPASSS